MKMGGALASVLFLAGIAQAQDAPKTNSVVLFDGKTLTGWTTPMGKPAPAGWEVTPDGAIHRKARAGDLISTRDFASFDLTFEWKVAPGVNSGLKYHFGKYGTATVGIEYQLIDTEKPGDNKGKHAVGSLYDLFAADPKALPKPAGEWNVSRIVVDGNHITHYLNGVKSVDVTMGSKEWADALAKSKFKAALDFGQKPGKILLQDHGGEVWFRSFQLKELAPSRPDDTNKG